MLYLLIFLLALLLQYYCNLFYSLYLRNVNCVREYLMNRTLQYKLLISITRQNCGYKFDIKLNETIMGVCIDIKNNCLYFVKNDNINFNSKYCYNCIDYDSQLMKTRFGNVTQEVDFVNFDYYFAMSRQICSCSNTKQVYTGNEMQVYFV